MTRQAQQTESNQSAAQAPDDGFHADGEDLESATLKAAAESGLLRELGFGEEPGDSSDSASAKEPGAQGDESPSETGETGATGEAGETGGTAGTSEEAQDLELEFSAKDPDSIARALDAVDPDKPMSPKLAKEVALLARLAKKQVAQANGAYASGKEKLGKAKAKWDKAQAALDRASAIEKRDESFRASVRSGDADQVLRALGEIMGTDGTTAFLDLSKKAAQKFAKEGGPKPQQFTADDVKRMVEDQVKARLDEESQRRNKETEAQRKERESEEAQAAQVEAQNSWLKGCGALLDESGEDLPLLSKSAKAALERGDMDGLRERLLRKANQLYKKTGEAQTPHQVTAALEKDLAAELSVYGIDPKADKTASEKTKQPAKADSGSDTGADAKPRETDDRPPRSVQRQEASPVNHADLSDEQLEEMALKAYRERDMGKELGLS